MVKKYRKDTMKNLKYFEMSDGRVEQRNDDWAVMDGHLGLLQQLYSGLFLLQVRGVNALDACTPRPLAPELQLLLLLLTID